MWPKRHLDFGNGHRNAASTAPLFSFSPQTCASNLSKHWTFFFAVSQCHYKTMFFLLCISYELTILSIFVATEEVVICSVTRWGPGFLLSESGFFQCCYISGCYCWPCCSPGKIFSTFPKRYNPHTHHTVSDPCLHDTWQIHCGVRACVCVRACEHERVCTLLCVCVNMCVLHRYVCKNTEHIWHSV